MRLEGKVGIITAAASGMGRAGSEIFAREGASVAVVDRDEQGINQVVEEITQAGGKAFAIGADLRDDRAAAEIVEKTVSEFGRLDFVWNHLGHPGPAAVEGVDMAEYDLAIDLNLRSQLVTTEAAIPYMREVGGGSMVFTASTAGISGSPQSPVYSMVKHGIVGFVRSLSRRLGPDNIRVNAVCPGPIDTPMLRVFVSRPDSSPDAPSRTAEEVEEMVAGRAGVVPLKRFGKPDEVANAAMFLISDDASFITGAALPVDGGITA
jgi:NAD(P)-dependent dehydrogenase (short-subunit alcohol dehydrogenase family)